MLSPASLAGLSCEPAGRVDPPRAAAVDGPTRDVVLLDEGHNSYHVIEGSNAALAGFLGDEGFQVLQRDAPLESPLLDSIDVLIVAMPLADRNRVRGDSTDWSLPNPSPFSTPEIQAVRDWVRGGGGLLMISDHMPVAGAMQELAAAFELEVSNGFAREVEGDEVLTGPIVYRRSDGSLLDHSITNGRTVSERVDSVVTFTGSAFRGAGPLEPLMVFRAGAVSLEPDRAWEFTEGTRRVPLEGWLQGGVRPYGRGRVALIGEAGMFFALLASMAEERAGEECEEPCWLEQASQNPRFLLNLVRWLARELD